MRSRLLRRWWVVCSWLIVMLLGRAAAWERPGEFQVVEEAVLRSQAVRDLDRFAKAFGGTPVATEAAKIAAAHGSSCGERNWVIATLDWVELALKAYPASNENEQVRRSILAILDYPMHVNLHPQRSSQVDGLRWAKAVGRHHQNGVGPAIKDIASSRTAGGLDVWKLYNMGFVVRSKNHCVGFDVHPGYFPHPYSLTDSQQGVLADRLEVVFISHVHGDHFSDRFVRRMLKAGKKVVLPAPIRKDLRHASIVRLYDDYKTPADLDGIKVCVFPGWQSRDTPVNVYAVNLDGHWVAHNGDNLRTRIYREIPSRCPIDVLLANCWSGVGAFIAATRPKLAITGHENELAHHVPDRVAYRTTFAYLDMIRKPPACRVIHWGEHLRWTPDQGR